MRAHPTLGGVGDIPAPQYSKAQRRMLQIVANAGVVGISARAVAEAMWPKSDSWSNPTARGRRRRRVVFGQGAQMRAGVMLADLHDAKLIAHGGRGWRVTEAGTAVLGEGRLL